MRLDTQRDGLHAFPITKAWKEMTRGVDAVFSYADKMYMIKVGLNVPVSKVAPGGVPI